MPSPETPIVKDESTYLQWNADPFQLGCDYSNANPRGNCGSGHSEYPGTVYLLPYWMSRFENIITT